MKMNSRIEKVESCITNVQGDSEEIDTRNTKDAEANRLLISGQR